MKTKDDYDNWKNYTPAYLRQVQDSPHDRIVKNSYISQDAAIVFKDNFHPNWKSVYYLCNKLNVKSAFECGTGPGQHLINLQLFYPNIKVHGIDISVAQIKSGEDLYPDHYHLVKDNIKLCDFSLPNAYQQFDVNPDFVFTQAVTMHLAQSKAKIFIENMLKLTKHYVYLVENTNVHPYLEILNKIDLNFNITWTSQCVPKDISQNNYILLTKN